VAEILLPLQFSLPGLTTLSKAIKSQPFIPFIFFCFQTKIKTKTETEEKNKKYIKKKKQK